jgi:calcium-dependent protein kinase
MDSLYAWICCQTCKKRKPSIIYDTELTESLLYKTDYEQRPIENVNQVRIKVSDYVVQRKFTSVGNIYHIHEELGEGSFGKVFKVIHKTTNEIRAMKQIKLSNFSEGFNNHELEDEINILKNLDHPNVLKIYEYFLDDVYLYLITEYCGQGDLLQKVQKAGYINEIIVKFIMYEILTAVAYLHARNVIHGDLKLENILIRTLAFSSKGSFNQACITDLEKYKRESKKSVAGVEQQHFEGFQNFQIKVIDFGCSKIFTKQTRHFTGMVGSALYMAPEVINGSYDEKADIWSCGVILYCLLAGYPPFNGETDDDTFELIKKGIYDFPKDPFGKISSAAKDLVNKLLIADPKKRLSAKVALNHPFFKNEVDTKKVLLNIKSSAHLFHRLKEQRVENKFQQAVITYICHNFGHNEETNKLTNLFKGLDDNKDGRISKQELLNGFKEIGIETTDEEVAAIMSSIDHDGNGYIEYEEFLRFMNKENLLTDSNLIAAFNFFDTDGSGLITFDEIKETILREQEIQDKVFDEFLGQLGKTREQTIDYSEFKEIMNKMH